MTLHEIVTIFEQIALAQPNVLTAESGSVYDILNGNPSVKYKAFVITQNTHRETETSDIYGLTLFMIDRLNDRLDNHVRIQSTAKEQLSNIVRIFIDNYDLEFPDNVIYTPFQQKFKDLTAGCYVQLNLEIFKSPCYDGEVPVWREQIKLQAKTIDITENGEYTVKPDNGYGGLSSVAIKVDVPQGDCRLQEKDFIINSNGTTQLVADAGYDGIAGGRIIVNVPIPEPDPCPETDYEPETLTVNITVDKHIEDLIGKQLVNVIYDGEDHKYTYRGEAITIPVPPGKIYTVEYLDVEDFDTPESTGEQYVSMWNGHREAVATYIYVGSKPSPEPITDCFTLAYQTEDKQPLRFALPNDSTLYKSNSYSGDWCFLVRNDDFPWYGISTQMFAMPNTLTSVIFPNCSEFITIGSYAFYCCHKLTSVNIPSSVNRINADAFNWSGLETVVLNEGLKEIGKWAFYHTNLESVTIPSTVIEIGYEAFNTQTPSDSTETPSDPSSAKLKEVIMKSFTPVPYTRSMFGNHPELVIYVPDNAVDDYKSAWTFYADNIKGISER